MHLLLAMCLLSAVCQAENDTAVCMTTHTRIMATEAAALILVCGSHVTYKSLSTLLGGQHPAGTFQQPLE